MIPSGVPGGVRSDYEVVRSDASMADALAAVQDACFPTLSPAERIRAEHYRAHVKVFPEGQHAVRERRDHAWATY